MKKRELLLIKKLMPTKSILEIAQNDIGTTKTNYGYSHTEYKYESYYRAFVENGILKIAIFMREELKNGNTAPLYELYIDKKEEEWLTHEPLEDKWYTAKIDNLDYGKYRGYIYGYRQYASKTTQDTVNKYLGTGKKEVKTAVLTFQNEVRGEQLKKKHKNELEEIDEVMNVVPELPKDFDDWTIKEAYINHRYIFYKPGKKEGHCTHCGEDVTVKVKPRHNEDGRCPNCKSKITFKSWNKQKTIVNNKNVSILQRLTDDSGFILRIFSCKIKFTKQNDWKSLLYHSYEQVRIKLNKNLKEERTFEYTSYKSTNITRWCYEINRAWYYAVDHSAVFYSRNLTRLLKNTHLRYMPISAMLNKNKGSSCYATSLLYELSNNPKYEYLMKAGLTKLVFRLCEGESLATSLEKKKPWEYLRITKEQFKECCKINASTCEVKILQRAKENNITITTKQLHWIAKYLGVNLLIGYMGYSTPHKMIRYLKENLQAETDSDVIGDYCDYLEECEKLELELDEQTLYPTNFMQTHERTSKLLLEKQDLEEAENKRLQNIQYAKSIEGKRELYKYENEDYIILLPENKEDFEEEGRTNHNCVASYFERVLRGECVVLFLREKSQQDISYCTVEIRGTNLIQCRLKYNKSARTEEIEFINKYLKELKKRLRKEEKQQLKDAM